MIQSSFRKYIYELDNVSGECKNFLMRQIERMPDFYRFGVKSIILILFLLKLKPKNLKLLNKLFMSLITVKKYEK